MKNVLIVNDEMVSGGVSKVLINMLKEVSYEDVNIDILILHPHGELLNDIPSNYHVLNSSSFFDVVDISFENIIKAKSFKLLIKKLSLLFLMKTGLIKKKIVKEREKILDKKYDVEIAYKEGFCTMFVAYGDAIKKVNWVHVDYKKFNYSRHHMKLMKDALNKIDAEVSPSIDASNSYKEIFGLKDDFLIIRNFVNTEEIITKANEPCKLSESFNIVSIGRLHSQKGFVRAMDVLGRLMDFDFHYYIVGEGEERPKIEKKIKTYGLEDKVTLVGYDANPYKYVKNADLFLVPSLYEGIPTVVYEGLIVGKAPILSTLVAGVSEQLNNGFLGMVCDNNEEALYKALKKILDDKESIKIYAQRMKKYKKDNSEMIDLFYKLICEK